MKVKAGLTPLCLFLLYGCGLAQPTQQHAVSIDKQVYFSDGTLFYYGTINQQKNAIAFALLEQNSANSFFISSPGGLVEDSIQLAYRLRAEGIDVHLGKVCASSCANYVVPAAHKVYVAKETALIWHGSSYQKDISQWVREHKADYIKWRAAEAAFFAELGLSPLITVCGIQDVSVSDELSHWLGLQKLVGFSYSLQDMKRFGLSNLTVAEGWHPASGYDGMNVVQGNYCTAVNWDF